MTLTYTYDGAAVTHNVAPSTASITSAAEDGEAAMSGLVIEDPDADLELLGHRPFIVEESACAQPRLFTGWTTERAIGRMVEDGLHGDATARGHDVTVIDLNAVFGFRLISGTDAKRPEETWAARMAWLLASDYLTGLIEDTGYIVVNTTAMDAADYTDGYPADVLRDLMDRSAGAYTFFAFWDTVASAVGLWVGGLDEAVSDSVLRISNVVADIDSTTTFAPDPEAKLSVTPTETYSEVVVTYAHGEKRLFRSRPSTAAKYIRRGTKTDRPYTGSQATASNQAERFLDQHANEQDRITVTIIVPAAKVGLLTAGQRLDVKFSHLTGYTTFTSMRCVRLTVTPVDDLARYYSMAMELLAPRVGTSGGCGSVALVQAATEGSSGQGPTGGTYYDLAAPVAAGNLIVIVAGHNAADPGDDKAGYTKVGHHVRSELYGGQDFTITVWTKIAAGGEQAFTATYSGGTINCNSATVAEYEGFCDTVTDLQIAGVFVLGTVATYPALAPSLPGASAILIRSDYKYPPDPGGSMTLAGWDLLGDTGFASSGPRMRLSTFHLIDPVADANYPALARSSSGTYPEEYGVAVTVAILGGLADTEVILPPSPGAPVTSTSDPTADDDIGDSYQVGQTWINTATGEAFVLVDNTLGAAVWTSTTAVSPAGAPTTADYLVGTAQGGLSAEIVVGTTPGGELGGTWASPTVDATHSGSAHLALGSTSSTAAAGDHAHAGGVGELVVVDGTTGPTGVIPNSYVEMTTPRTTTSATLVDITGATTTITIQRPSDIAVWMTAHVSASASCDLGLAINVDGTDHDLTDTHLTSTDEGNVAIMHRTVSKLAPGTYTVKGRFQRTSGGGTPSVDRVDLLVSALTTSGPVLVTTDDETDYVYADLA